MATQVSGIIEQIQPSGSSGTKYAIASTAYGYCQTAANQKAKNVDMTGFKLIKGVTIHVKFQYNNTAASPTLNVNGTGALNIVQYGTTAVGTTDETNSWYAGAVVSFTYDGTSWVRDQGFNTNSQSAYGNITTSGTLGTASQAVVTDSNKKITTADLTVSDNTTIGTTATSFVAKVTQAAQGKITVTKAALPTASTDTAGITKVGASGGAAAYNHNHDTIYSAIHQTTWSWASDGTQPLSKYVTFDSNIAAGNAANAPDAGWYNGFVSSHGNYLGSFILNKHRTSNWYVGWEQYPKDSSTNYTAPTWYLLAHSGNVSTGDNNGQIKIAGQNIEVKGLAALAYKSSLSAADIPDLSWNKITSDKPAYTTRWPAWDEITGKPTSFTPASHTHDFLNSKGNVTAETEGNKPAQKGLSMQNAYNNGYPTTYGNVLTMYGAGATQLFMGWSGSSNSTTGVHADAYIRSQRDTNGSLWSDWAKLLDTANYKTYTVSSIAGLTGDVTLAQLGLSSALRYQGTTTTAMSDGLATATVTIGGNSFTPTQGDVVIYNDAEYVWTGSLWELLGAESSFKKVQTEVNSSSASGNSATTFVSSVTQDTQGVITVKTSTLNTSGTWSGTANFLNYHTQLSTKEAVDGFHSNATGIKAAKVSSIAMNDTDTWNSNDGIIIDIPWSNLYGHQVYIDDNSYQIHHRYGTSKTVDGVNVIDWKPWVKAIYTDSRSSVGSSTQPIYIDTNGKIVACTSYANASVNYATSAGTANSVAWANISSKPIELGSYSGALNSNGWKTMGARTSGAKIYIAYNNNPASWNSATYSSSIVFGCGDTKGLLDIGHSNPIVTFGGSSNGNSTDNDPKWYFKLSATSGQTYTFPTTSKTLAASDGSNASGTWGISISGKAGSVDWANTGHPATFPPETHTHDYAPSSTISCTTANVKSALGTDTSTTNQWLNKKGEWSTPTAEQIGAAASDHNHNTTYLRLDGSNTMTGTLNIKPTSGEGGELHLHAVANTEAGIVLDHYGNSLRIFGIASADGTTKTGVGTPLVIDPYAKTITGGYTITGNLSGTATTADKLTGFSSRASTMTWGNQTGSVITCFASSGGGGWGFRDNNPASGQLSMTIDGTIYIKEGAVNIGDAIKSITRSGNTFTYTTLWGGTGTFTQTDANVAHTLGTTTKYYVTGTTSATTSTAGDTFDTGVYVTTTVGELSAVRHSWNISGAEKAYTTYNSTDDSIDFVFV